MRRLLVLDCDGVINEFCLSVGGIPVAKWSKDSCVEQLNRIIAECEPEIVISSNWRRYVHEGHMTIDGFRILMMAIGVRRTERIISITADGPLAERGRQIREWLRSCDPYPDKIVALDDMELGHAAWGIPLVQTDGRVGLTEKDADRVIAMLKGD